MSLRIATLIRCSCLQAKPGCRKLYSTLSNSTFLQSRRLIFSRSHTYYSESGSSDPSPLVSTSRTGIRTGFKQFLKLTTLLSVSASAAGLYYAYQWNPEHEEDEYMQAEENGDSSSEEDPDGDTLIVTATWNKIQAQHQSRNALVRFLSTSLRLFELFLRFLPVLLSFPVMCYVFRSQRDRWFRFLCWTLSQSGASFIKLGQWVATRRDLFPEELCDRLKSLHSHAPFHSFAQTRKVIETSYGGRSIESVFESFDPVPVAAGAIAQVHRAVVNGQAVAVKVRHPNVEIRVIRDLNILNWLARTITYLLPKRLAAVDLIGITQEFSRVMTVQLDLKLEAHSLERFTINFATARDIRFPRPFTDLCTEAVLVETFENGTEISAYLNDPNTALKKRLARQGLDMFLQMMLRDNFTHADLHPGNILVRLPPQQGSTPEPCLIILDAGLVTQLTHRDWKNFRDLFSAIVSRDAELAATLMIERSRRNLATPEQAAKFRKEMSVLINEVMQEDLTKVRVGSVLSEVLRIGRENRIGIESNFSSLVLGIIVVEGMARSLDPDLNFVSQAAPFILASKQMRRTVRYALLRRLHSLLHGKPMVSPLQGLI